GRAARRRSEGPTLGRPPVGTPSSEKECLNDKAFVEPLVHRLVCGEVVGHAAALWYQERVTRAGERMLVLGSGPVRVTPITPDPERLHRRLPEGCTSIALPVSRRRRKRRERFELTS